MKAAEHFEVRSDTADAKLATGIDSGELRAQGVLYLLDSLDRDPITLTAIAVRSWWQRFSEALPRARLRPA